MVEQLRDGGRDNLPDDLRQRMHYAEVISRGRAAPGRGLRFADSIGAVEANGKRRLEHVFARMAWTRPFGRRDHHKAATFG
jgi:hypothetical protein